MRKSGFWFFVLLSVAAISVSIFGAAMMAQDEAPLLLFTRYNSEIERDDLYVLNAATGEERFITAFIRDSDAGWTPDGRIWIVERLEDELARRMRFFDAQTGEESLFEHRISYSPCFALVYWSPNGEQMAYVTETGNDYFLNVQNLDGSGYQIGMAENDYVLWSPDSQYLYLGMAYSRSLASLISAEDGSILSEADFIDFSPDSRYISYRDAADNLYLYEIATGESIAFPATDYGYWSASGRYFLIADYQASENLALRYYDTHAQRLETVTLDIPLHYAVWTADETGIFLFLGFDNESYFPTRLLYYDLASQSSTTILENTTRVAGLIQNGDWFAISYNTNEIGDPRETPNALLLYNGTQRMEFEETGEFPGLSAHIMEDDFIIDSHTEIRYFDTSSNQLESIFTGLAYRLTVHGDYLAFIDGEQLQIWHQESRSIHVVVEDIGWIIGWQGSSTRESLLYCGEG